MYTRPVNCFAWVFQEPICNEMSTTVCSLSCQTGSVTSRLKLDRRGYAPGEDIFVDCEVVNMSEQSMSTVSLILQAVMIHNILHVFLFQTENKKEIHVGVTGF